MLLKANTKIELSDLTHTNQRHYPALNTTNNLKDTIKQEAKEKVGGLWHILHGSLEPVSYWTHSLWLSVIDEVTKCNLWATSPNRV